MDVQERVRKRHAKAKMYVAEGRVAECGKTETYVANNYPYQV